MAVAMPVLRRVLEVGHCGIGDRMHCGAAVRMADRMGHQTALWMVSRIAAEIAEVITGGAQEEEMSWFRQVAVTWPVSVILRLAALYRYCYTRPACDKAVQEIPGAGEEIGVRSKCRYQRAEGNMTEGQETPRVGTAVDSGHGSTSISHARGGIMSRRPIMCMVLCILCAVSSGQWLETTIYLPDSFTGMSRLWALAYHSTTNTIYVAGVEGGCLMAVDGTTSQKFARIPVDRGLIGLCSDPLDNKVFCANYDCDTISVIDAASNQVVERIPTGGPPYGNPCFNPHDRKIYCTTYNADSGDLVVIDAVTNQLIARVVTGAFNLCYDSVDNRIFCVRMGSAIVIDGTSNAVVGTVSGYWGYLCYNGRDNKVYAASSWTVSVIDGTTMQVTATVPVGESPNALCYNPQENKVYCSNESTDNVTVIDGATDEVLATVPVGDWPRWLTYLPGANNVYCGNWVGNSVSVIDGVSNQLVSTISATYEPIALCANSRDNRAYCANATGNDVTVIDGTTNEVIASVSMGVYPRALCYNPHNDKVYTANAGNNSVAVIDGATNEAVAYAPVGRNPLALCYNPVDNRLYSANYMSHDVTVIDGESNEVMATVPAGWTPYALCYNPRNNKVYCANYGGTITVIDGRTSTVLANLYGGGSGTCALCYNSVDNRIYSVSREWGEMVVVDGEGDYVITTLDAPFGSRLCYNPQNDKVYTNDIDTVVVVDGAQNRVVARVAVGSGPGALCYNPRTNEVYCVTGESSGISVVDGATNVVVATVNVGGWQDVLLCDSASNTIYCANSERGDVTAIDGSIHRVRWTIPAGDQPGSLCFDPLRNRVYATNCRRSAVSVLRDSGVGVEESLKQKATGSRLEPTVVRGILYLWLGTRSELPGRNSVMSRAVLLDAAGRRVMVLQAGPNDVRGLAPGVYFVREEAQVQGRESQVVRKVIIGR